MNYLVLVRHGQSMRNLKNVFTGWVDIPLTPIGIHEALICAQKLASLPIDVAFTSKLVRAQQTLLTILSQQDRVGIFLHDEPTMLGKGLHPADFADNEIPIYSDVALNERHYWALQWLNKAETAKKYGEKLVHERRRSYSTRPPEWESLEDTCNRAVPYFLEKIFPQVQGWKNVLVAAHWNSLRAIIKHIESISDEDIPSLELETGVPIIYQYVDGKLIKESL